MKILLVNPPHTAIGSRIPKENLPPLGLLAIGGPLIDAGFDVALLNADLAPLSVADVIEEVLKAGADALLIGHSGSTTAHLTVCEICAGVKAAAPHITIVYGGVFPTYHWQEVLEEAPAIDVVVRGEGEATAVAVMEALNNAGDLQMVRGIAYRENGLPCATTPATIIADLDSHRTGWELIDFADYSYWGGKRSVILQFSRGCPHLCTYCGQRGFWTKWRHRDPQKLAAEVAWLVREHGVELVNLADENPTSSRRQWKAFLEALIAENVDVLIVGSTRADDIVRDRDILPLYKKAGVIRFLMGLEGTDEATLEAVKKGGSRSMDRQAIQLLREHGMIGLCTFAVGFEEETDADYARMMRMLLAYDPDQIMSVYATPHRWTPFFEASKNRRVVQADLRRWDYKHQVLEVPRVPAWRVFLWVKFIEFVLQTRPKVIQRTFFNRDADVRHAMQWYAKMGRRVVLQEVWEWLFAYRNRPGKTIAAFWKSGEMLPEHAMSRPKKGVSVEAGSPVLSPRPPMPSVSDSPARSIR